MNNEIVVFHCPGCNDGHAVRIQGNHPVWIWNGSLDTPTFAPSIVIKTGHYVSGRNGDSCWCTYNKENPDKPAPFECSICHSFVVDGKIQFLSDCTHKLAGQTLELPDWNSDAV